MTATTAPAPTSNPTPSDRCSLSSLQVNSDQSSETSSSTPAPPSRFIIKPVDENKPDTAPDKRTLPVTVESDKENTKSTSEHVQLPGHQQQNVVNNTRDTVQTKEHNMYESHQKTYASNGTSLEDIRQLPDWFRKDQDYISLVSKHDNEIKEIKARHTTETRSLYQKKVQSAPANLSNMTITRDSSLARPRKSSKTYSHCRSGSTSNSDLMGVLPQILSTTSMETDGHSKCASIESQNLSSELVHRHSNLDMHEAANNPVMYPVMMPSYPNAWAHGQSLSSWGPSSFPQWATSQHSIQAGPGGVQRQVIIVPQQSGGSIVHPSFLSNTQSAMSLPQGYHVLRQEDFANLHN